MDLGKAIGSIIQRMRPQDQKVISPVPVEQKMTSSLEHWYKMDQQRADSARKANQMGIRSAQNTQPNRYHPAIGNGPQNRPSATPTPASKFVSNVLGAVKKPVSQAQTQGKPAPISQTRAQILKNIQKGFERYGNPPIATMAAELAAVGEEVMQRGGNPYLPAALTLKETSGLKHVPAQRINNPVGIGPGISYPDLEVAIMGGGPQNQQGLRGVLTSPYYDDYYASGDLVDFFKRYTPQESHNNPTYEEQIRLMNTLLDLFQK